MSDAKSWCIAAIGTLTSIGLAHLNLILSSLAALATFIFGCFKCYDWIEARIQKRKAKKTDAP